MFSSWCELRRLFLFFLFARKKMGKPELKSPKFNMEVHLRGRERLMRRKRLGSFKGTRVLLFILIFANFWNFENAKCTYNEIKQCNSTSCKCIPCKSCSPGEGLFPQCGSSATKKDVIGCVPCESGITFSSENNTESCKPCQLCEEGRKVLRKCTATQNAKCSKECMKGYKLDPFSHMCEKMTPNTRKPTTNTYEHPTNHSLKSTALTTVRANNDPEGKVGLETTENTTTTKATPHQEDKSNKSQIKSAVLIPCAVIFTLLAAVISVLAYFLCKRKKTDSICCLCSRKISADQKRQTQDAEESIPMWQTCDGHACLLLKDIKHELAEKIAVQLSRPNLKGWKQIGWKLKIPEESLLAIETYSGYGTAPKLPGTKFLEFLETSQPSITLKRFVEVLKSIQRNDIVQGIQDEYQNSCIAV